MGNIVVNVRFLPLTSVVHFRIRYLHVPKQNLAKCVVILTSELKLNDETSRNDEEIIYL